MNRMEIDTAGETTSITLHHYMNQNTRKTLITGRKLKTPSILLSEKEKGRKNKGGQKMSNEEYGNDWEKKTLEKVYELNSDKELDGDLGTADHDNDRGNYNKEHITREK